MTGLKQYERKGTCQWGETGVIDEIFNRIGIENKTCVCVGSWDGKHFSNTYHLAEQGWQRIMFEKDETRGGVIFPKDVCCFKEVDDLDYYLGPMQLPIEFDFLSIDIDGNDYWLWHDIKRFKPRVICIEYNQTVAPGVSVIQERGGTFGASSKALMDLAETKGYYFVHATVTNMFFVQRQYAKHFPATSGIPTEWVVYGGIGYNGKRYQFGKQAHNDNQGGRHEKLITVKEIVEV